MRKVILPIHPFIFIGMYLESGWSIGVVNLKKLSGPNKEVFQHHAIDRSLLISHEFLFGNPEAEQWPQGKRYV